MQSMLCACWVLQRLAASEGARALAESKLGRQLEVEEEEEVGSNVLA